MTLGARADTIEPTRKLDFISAAGTTGMSVSTSAGAPTVKTIPAVIHMIDTSKQAAGPLRAISSSSFLEPGKDRSGVMHPKVPICSDGRGTGRNTRR